MDGLSNPFTRLHELDAWEVAKKHDDPYLALFGLLLTEGDIEFLHGLRIFGADTRR
jgi:hypothetical protein